MKHVIIGAVAGGATAAARIRRVDETAEILILDKGAYMSYANCGLPYYLGGIIQKREELFLQTPEAFHDRYNVTVRLNSEVIDILPDQKSIRIREKGKKDYLESYDNLLLSPGATPFVPPLNGINSENIFTLRNVHDTDLIKNHIANKKVKTAAIIGAGFIGIEMAENLTLTGIKISIIEMQNQVMPPLDYVMATDIHKHLCEKGVNLFLGEKVNGFKDKDGKTSVLLDSGKKVDVDMVILSIGVRPETDLAKKAGIRIGKARGIWVDQFLQTNIENIYAVGDAIEYPSPISGQPYLNYLANPANRQARIVADNMVFGNHITYEGSIATAIAKIFDMTAASTGLSTARLDAAGMENTCAMIHSKSHAGYYPNAQMTSIKLTFHPRTGKLYGGQIIGFEGVDKRIDQIALCIKMGGTVFDLIKLEHAYAPPFSSAKDPVAIAGYVASNIIDGKMPRITWKEVVNKDSKEFILLDVRDPEEIEENGKIPSSINIPLNTLRERLNELDKNANIITYCAIGLRGYLAMRILEGHGFKNVKNLIGGYKTYAMATAKAPIGGLCSPK